MVKRLPRVEIKMAVLAVISKRSKRRDRTIAAASLREIKNDLKKNYLKDVTERQVLNVIRTWEIWLLRKGILATEGEPFTG